MNMPRALRRSLGGGLFLISQVPLCQVLLVEAMALDRKKANGGIFRITAIALNTSTPWNSCTLMQISCFCKVVVSCFCKVVEPLPGASGGCNGAGQGRHDRGHIPHHCHQKQVPPFPLSLPVRLVRSRGWHTVRQSAPTVWLRRPRDRPKGGRGLGRWSVLAARRRCRCWTAPRSTPSLPLLLSPSEHRLHLSAISCISIFVSLKSLHP